MKNRSKKAIAAAFAIRAVNTESVPTRCEPLSDVPEDEDKRV